MIFDLFLAYKYTFLLLSIGLIIKGLELIKISNFFKNQKQMDWEIVGLDKMKLSIFSTIYRNIYSQKGVSVICIISIISIAIILMTKSDFILSIFGIILFISQFLLHHRSEYGGDGADQMSFLIILTLLLCFFTNDSVEIRKLGLIFISSQLLLSYFVSGFAKLISKEWRTGSAVLGVMSTFTYGTPYLKTFLHRYPIISLLIGWYIILMETLFPLILLLPFNYFICFALLGMCLHFSIGIFMGLNDFIWSFFAAYPALFYVYINLI